MDKNTKYVLGTILILFSLLVIYRYYQNFILKNFIIDVNTSCNPNVESCFATECEEGAECTIDPYKKVSILSKSAPKCLEEHSCQEFTCTNLNNCQITYCSDETLSDGEICVPLNTNEEIQ